MERQPDHYMQALVLSVSVIRHDTMLAFSLNDGSIDFRFRDSLELASADGNNEDVHTLPQSGFAFPAHEPGMWSLNTLSQVLTRKSLVYYFVSEFMLCSHYAS
jgi:hypothetical protein